MTKNYTPKKHLKMIMPTSEILGIFYSDKDYTLYVAFYSANI